MISGSGRKLLSFKSQGRYIDLNTMKFIAVNEKTDKNMIKTISQADIKHLYYPKFTKKIEKKLKLDLGYGVFIDGEAKFYPLEYVYTNLLIIDKTNKGRVFFIYIPYDKSFSVAYFINNENDILLTDFVNRLFNGIVNYNMLSIMIKGKPYTFDPLFKRQTKPPLSNNTIKERKKKYMEYMEDIVENAIDFINVQFISLTLWKKQYKHTLIMKKESIVDNFSKLEKIPFFSYKYLCKNIIFKLNNNNRITYVTHDTPKQTQFRINHHKKYMKNPDFKYVFDKILNTQNYDIIDIHKFSRLMIQYYTPEYLLNPINDNFKPIEIMREYISLLPNYTNTVVFTNDYFRKNIDVMYYSDEQNTPRHIIRQMKETYKHFICCNVFVYIYLDKVSQYSHGRKLNVKNFPFERIKNYK